MTIEEIQKSLPQAIAQKLYGYEWQEILVGHSESKVFRLKHSYSDTIYLKISSNDSFPSLWQEKKRLDWLNGKLPVPQSLMFTMSKGMSYFLISEISGVNSSEISDRGNERDLIQQLTKGLEQIQGLPIEDCPFDMRLDRKIKLAEERMRKGLVDEGDFDEERIGRTAENLFTELIQTRPTDEDLVFTHGDYCLPNIILENGKISGFIDWGSAGVADRYQDIALLTRSLKYNFSAEWTKNIFELLGIKPNTQKIHFYTLLDEFF